MLHGSISHLFFSQQEKTTEKLPDSYRNHPGWGVTPTNRETEGPPRKSQESKRGRARKVRWFHRSCLGGGYVQDLGVEGVEKKKWEGVLEIVVLCLRVMYLANFQ